MCSVQHTVSLVTRKRAIANALQLKGHSDFAPVDVAYYQHFLFFLFENIAFLEVPPSNDKYRLAYLMLTSSVMPRDLHSRGAVSYTHLTLPTKRIV